MRAARRREKTIAAQLKLIADPEADGPKNDGLGFARIMVGGELGDEADVELRNRAERETRRPEWAGVPEEVKEAFVALYGTASPPEEIAGYADKLAVIAALAGPW